MLSSMNPRAILPLGLLVALALLLLAPTAVPAAQARTVSAGLERAHAHNDYEHDRPLFDALGRQFKVAEADVWLVDGKLIVSHDDPRLPATAAPKGPSSPSTSGRCASA